MEVTIRYEEIKKELENQCKFKVDLQQEYEIKGIKKCRIINAEVLDCGVYVWFRKVKPTVCLIPKNGVLNINITPILKDTEFYWKLCKLDMDMKTEIKKEEI